MPEQDDAPKGGDKTFTQAELDAIIADRLKRQAAQLKAQVPDEDELQALRDAKKQLDAIEETSKDDLERANDKIEKLQAKLTEKESENSTLTTKLRDTTVKQLVTAEAAKAQFKIGEDDDPLPFVDPEDAFTNLDMTKVEFDEEGNATNIADLVSAVAASKPHYLGARRQAGPDMDLGPRETTTDNPEMTAEQEHAQFLAKIL
jgi:seryl-tRNA synthetase